MRIQSQELKTMLYDILRSRDVPNDTAAIAAENFTGNSLDGVYSHGVNRFPRVIDYIDRGKIDVHAKATCVASIGAFERWDGRLALGNVNAVRAMDRACDLAAEHGIGCVAIGNTNHWMRGGSFGWQAADRGCIGMCWTNTMPNTPAWGGVEPKIGNNPFVISIPRENGRHVVVDIAMTQFAFGKIEMASMLGEKLSVPGGFDDAGNVTDDPKTIEQSGRALTIGYWKGSSLSICLDLAAAVLSAGNTVTSVGRKYTDEVGLSQVMVAFDSRVLGKGEGEALADEVIADIKSSTPVRTGEAIRYPGELEYRTRMQNLAEGIPVLPEIWDRIEKLHARL